MPTASTLASQLKRAGRRAVDRVVLPYVEQLRADLDASRPAPGPAEPAAATESAGGRTSDFFHGVLHELRTLELERIPAGGRVLSVGASGRWYFDWFERHVGAFDEHVGVEAFEPEPDDLPGYARWIDSTADRFPGVDDASVDVVFAGQTTEHLWPEELVGFLTESHRVTRPGGLLVADSPNRLVTEHMAWSHGGHTLELSAAEYCRLAELAGFEVLDVRGLWRCRMDDGRVLQLEDGLDDAVTLTRRIAQGGDRVDDSFVWWVTARRGDGAPEVDKLRREVDRLFEEHFSTRVSRGMWPGPGSPGPVVEPGDSGLVAASLPMFLDPGSWRVAVRLDDGRWEDLDDVRVDVTSPGGHLIHRLEVSDAEVEGDERSWVVHHPDLILALSLEIHVGSVSLPARFAMPVDVSPVRD